MYTEYCKSNVNCSRSNANKNLDIKYSMKSLFNYMHFHFLAAHM